MELNNDFFQKYLDMISESFKQKDMCIVHTQDNEGEDVYVLCALRLNAHTHDLDLIPVATMFSKNPYKSMQPVSNDEEAIVAVQQNLRVTARAQTPWAPDFSVN